MEQYSKQAVLHMLYEQLLFMVACYSNVQVDIAQINNEYVAALLDAVLNDGELSEAILDEYQNLMQYRGILDMCGGNGQAVVDAIMARVTALQGM
jgi:hypothetical protein